jgi:biopolymer transport protein ExbD
MSGFSPGPSRRPKPTEEGLNLVPYIDLLTCMIAFLLITAVWTQVAQLKISRRGPHGDEAEPEPPRTNLTVLVGAEGFNVIVGTERQLFPRHPAGYDYPALSAALDQVKRAHPDKSDAVVASEDQIEFGTLVATMDAVLAAGFPAVSLQGTE